MATFTTNTGEGHCQTANDAVWANVRGATSSLSVATNDLGIYTAVTGGPIYNLIRGFFPFDTSSIPDGATILSASIKLYRYDAISSFSNGDSTTLEVVQTTQASPTSLVSADIDNVTFTSGGSLAFASTSNNSYAEITLNGTGLTWISKTGHTLLAVISGRDLSNSAPTGINSLAFQDRADANPPTLTVTYQSESASLSPSSSQSPSLSLSPSASASPSSSSSRSASSSASSSVSRSSSASASRSLSPSASNSPSPSLSLSPSSSPSSSPSASPSPASYTAVYTTVGNTFISKYTDWPSIP